jgi:hypothetical protein
LLLVFAAERRRNKARYYGARVARDGETHTKLPHFAGFLNLPEVV